MTRVLIADDHGVVRDALARMLQTDGEFEIVATADDGQSAVQLATAHKPDVVLMDLTMPEGGIDLVKRLGELALGFRILVLTMHRSKALCRQALEAGASGFTLKSGTGADLTAAIRTVVDGQVYVHPTLAPDVLPGAATSPATAPPDSWDRLSARQQQVVRWVAMGHNNREISEKLGLSVKTVETHRARAMAGLGLDTRAQLVQFLMGRGLIGSVEE